MKIRHWLTRYIARITLYQKLVGFGLLAALMTMAVGAAGYEGLTKTISASDALSAAGAVQREQANADATNAAIRGDVISAIVAATKHDNETERGVLNDLKADTLNFRNSLARAKSLSRSDEVNKRIEELSPLANTYISDAEELGSLAFRNTPQALTKLDNFEADYKSLDAEMSDVADIIAKNTRQTQSEGETAGAWARRLIIGISLAALVAGFGISVWIVMSITGPMRRMAEAATKIAQGDIDQVIDHTSGDEIGVLANAFHELVEYIKDIAAAADALNKGDRTCTVIPKSEKDILSRHFIGVSNTLYSVVDEIQLVVRAAQNGTFTVRGDDGKFQGIYKELIRGLNEVLDAISSPINEAAESLQGVAARDLTVRMNGEYKGDFAKIKDGLNTAVRNLEGALFQVAEVTSGVSAASDQITSGSQELAEGAAHQASSLAEIASSLQQLAMMSKQNSANAQEARNLSDVARSSAGRGTDSMKRLSSAIEKIKISADATARIVKTIDEIAFQTNLLALNAAVEAARAGDAGRGFAVVAEEVRNLSKRSAEAARNTSSLIEESVRNAESGVLINEEVLNNLGEINGKIQKVNEVMAEIAAASDQQSQGVEQINIAVEQINQVTQQAASNAEESASGAKELSAQAQEMQRMVGTFRFSTVRPSQSPETTPQPLKESVPAIFDDGDRAWFQRKVVRAFDSKSDVLA